VHTYLTLFELLGHGTEIHRVRDDIKVIWSVALSDSLKEGIRMLIKATCHHEHDECRSERMSG